jgi:hypothetical protein
MESLEDRRLLTMADIVFLVDESASEDHSWLKQWVSGDTDGNGVPDVSTLAERLAADGVNDIRYGLVGFGESYQGTSVGTFYFFALAEAGAGTMGGVITH